MRTSTSPSLRELIARRVSRRQVLVSGTALALANALMGCGRSASAPSARESGFTPIAGSRADAIELAPGYRVNLVVRWGDTLFSDTESLDDVTLASGGLLAPGAGERQARQFGYNCDGLGLFELAPDRLVACVNHEFPTPSLMFPGWRSALQSRNADRFAVSYPESVAVMQAAVGVSVLELEHDADSGWHPVVDSPYNRRLTAHTPIDIAGPARDHRLVGDSCFGTLGNCAAGVTPWGTYLTAEENIQDYFSGTDGKRFDADASGIHERFGLRRRSSLYRWEHVDARFALDHAPSEPFKFGWIVEIDPLDATYSVKKRTALGRFKHEAATVTVTRDGRAAVYLGDDEAFEYLYKFVSTAAIDHTDRTANRGLLDEGVLHVARLDESGLGEWLPLVWSESGVLSPRTGFTSQADVVLNCRRAADLLGATPLDRPEDVAIDPLTGRVYLACTQNAGRGDPALPLAPHSGAPNRVDAANPRVGNRYGHILELTEREGDAGALQFRWEPLLVAGQPSAKTLKSTLGPLASDEVYFGGIESSVGLSGFGCPDNLTFDDRGNLWIVTDGEQPLGTNNGCFVCPTSGPQRGAVKQFMSGPIDAEICGCEITRDQRTLFLNVQHPGSTGSIESPTSHWPDGDDTVARPSMVAIQPLAATAKLGD